MVDKRVTQVNIYISTFFLQWQRLNSKRCSIRSAVFFLFVYYIYRIVIILFVFTPHSNFYISLQIKYIYIYTVLSIDLYLRVRRITHIYTPTHTRPLEQVRFTTMSGRTSTDILYVAIRYPLRRDGFPYRDTIFYFLRRKVDVV